MLETKPFIHLFETRGSYYIYDVNTNLILKTSHDVYNTLQDLLVGNELQKAEPNSGIFDEIEEIKKNGFLLSDRLDQIEHPADEYLQDVLKSRLNMIILQVTQQCNLRCKYCAYSGNYENRTHENKRMSLETAKKGIDFLIDHSSDMNRIAVSFYGGEPLLEFELVKECISYTERMAEGKIVTFHMTSNGTLLNAQNVDFLQQHNVRLMISLDGPQEIHDKNRRFASNGQGSFGKIMANLEEIRLKYPEYYNTIFFSVVLDTNTDFKCTNDFFSTTDSLKDIYLNVSPVSDRYAKNKKDVDEEFVIQTGYETFKAFLGKLGRLDRKYISRLMSQNVDRIKTDIYDNRRPEKVLKGKGHHGGPCIPGAQRLFMSVNGDLFPCERVSEESSAMKIGHVDSGFVLDRIKEQLNIGKLTESNCRNCWAFRFCHLCAANADNMEELSAEKKLSNCRNVRLSAEDSIKNFCLLKEFGHDFSKDEIAIPQMLAQ